MAERALILGGGGFIGSHLAERHLRAGDEVHIAVRPGWRRPSPTFLPNAAVLPADLGETEQIEDLFAAARPTLVYHLATATPHSAAAPADHFDPVWLEEARNLARIIDVARRYRPEIKAFVRSGTIAEYGSSSAPMREDDREQPATAYGAALLTATHYLGLVARDLPFRTVTARLALTYGPGQNEAFLVPALLRHSLARKPFHVRDPACRRDMIHVDDVTRGLMTLARADLAAGEIVNICSGVALSNRHIAETVWARTGAPRELLTFGAAGAASSVLWSSTHKARDLIGFEARIPFDQGIERTVRVLTARSD